MPYRLAPQVLCPLAGVAGPAPPCHSCPRQSEPARRASARRGLRPGALLALFAGGLGLGALLLADLTLGGVVRTRREVQGTRSLVDGLSTSLERIERRIEHLDRQLALTKRASATKSAPREPKPRPSVWSTWATARADDQPRIRTVVTVPRRLLLGSDGSLSARVVPVASGGFRVYGLRPGSTWARLGLANGDQIRRVAGVRLDTPDRALAAYRRLRSQRSFSIDLRRHGIRHRILVRLRS